MSEQHVGILGTGSYLPKEEITNAEIAERVGVTEEWITSKTRIRTRRYAAPDEATSDLAVRAAAEALAQAGLSPQQIDYLVVSTSTGDFPQPPTSYLVQEKLAAHAAACLDINVVCSGFVYGLAVAQGMLALRPGSRALVVAADLYSRILNFSDRRTAVLLGDGAGAAVVGPVPDGYGFLDTTLISRGDQSELVKVPAGGSRRPASHETVDEGGHFFTMHGRGVKEFVLDTMPDALAEVARKGRLRLDEIDHFVPHQPNGNLLDDLVEHAKLSGSRTHRTVERYGNVGSASVPVTLDHAHRSGELAAGDKVLLAAFGGGMSIGASLLTWAPIG
jgi:acetoacetyl-CoA synthase